jgi:hypothetical protein
MGEIGTLATHCRSILMERKYHSRLFLQSYKVQKNSYTPNLKKTLKIIPGIPSTS